MLFAKMRAAETRSEPPVDVYKIGLAKSCSVAFANYGKCNNCLKKSNRKDEIL
jgi:hypothetical protein